MATNPIAVVTFFSKTTCGYCKQFKGEIKDDRTGVVTIDPNSGWETLTSDLDLQNMGIVFNLYQFGPEQDPKTGKVLNYVLSAPYSENGRIRGVPHLELSIPGDPTKYSPFNPSGITGWKAEGSVPVIKQWIIKTLQTEPFKSYAADVRSGRVNTPAQKVEPPRSTPPPSQPVVRSPVRQPIQQPARQEGSESFFDSETQKMAETQFQARQDQIQKRQQVRTAPTTFGMGTQQIKPVVTPASIQVTPPRRQVVPPNTVEKPKPRFLPSNYDE